MQQRDGNIKVEQFNARDPFLRDDDFDTIHAMRPNRNEQNKIIESCKRKY